MTRKVVTYHEIKPAGACRYDGVAVDDRRPYPPSDVPLKNDITMFGEGKIAGRNPHAL
mgnify:CR=1 FL=1